MVSQELTAYIKQQLAAGYDVNSIRDTLVSSGYPIREVEDALDAAAKKPAPAKQAPQQLKPEDILKAHATGKAEMAIVPSHEKEELGILTLLRMWFLSLSMPKQVFYEARNYASFNSSLLNVSAAAAIGGLLGGAVFLAKFLMDRSAGYAGANIFGIGGLFTKVGTIERLFVTPIEAILVWISITAFIYLFSALIGGNGSYEKFAYFTSIAYAPTIMFAGLLQVLVPPCIVFFSYIAFGILGIYPTLIAIRDVHKFDLTKTIIAFAIPIAIVVVFLLPVILDIKSIFDAVCIAKVAVPQT